MTRIINFVVVTAFVSALAACATPQPQATAQDFTPPRQALDAKTQLETGRSYNR